VEPRDFVEKMEGKSANECMDVVKPGSVAILNQLRAQMKELDLDAIIVPSEDAHQSEYTPSRDQRRAFVSGFTGSAGTCVVTHEHALLWTDGRYFLQALDQLDSEHWALMRHLEKGTPTIEEWLTSNLEAKSMVGMDDQFLSVSNYRTYQKKLEEKEIRLILYSELGILNPVDSIWGDSQPLHDPNPVLIHDIKYSGLSVSEKLDKIRQTMKNEKETDALLLTALDEVCWVYNIRGSDIQYNPVVISFCLIKMDEAFLFIDSEKLSDEVKSHLESAHVRILPYSSTYLAKVTHSLDSIYVDPNVCNYALYLSLTKYRDGIPLTIKEGPSPVNLMKAIKTKEEQESMKEAHIRDGAALTAFLAWLDYEVKVEGRNDVYTEYTIAEKLEWFRSQQDKFVSLSFATISSIGSNGAIIHYKPSENTCKTINDRELILLDSGGQYLDGTTDVTRTFHLGVPSDREKFAFTLVLQGHIALASAIFPDGTMGSKLDILARLPLWKYGLDYKHGTGHGVGAFLNVHEGPQSISYKKRAYEEGLMEGMITSNEPGYYETGAFGIRIESLVTAVKKDEAGAGDNIGFETITMAPIQQQMINMEMLTSQEKQWLNNYHKEVREKLEPLLKENQLALDYLYRETEPIEV